MEGDTARVQEPALSCTAESATAALTVDRCRLPRHRCCAPRAFFPPFLLPPCPPAPLPRTAGRTATLHFTPVSCTGSSSFRSSCCAVFRCHSSQLRTSLDDVRPPVPHARCIPRAVHGAQSTGHAERRCHARLEQRATMDEAQRGCSNSSGGGGGEERRRTTADRTAALAVRDTTGRRVCTAQMGQAARDGIAAAGLRLARCTNSRSSFICLLFAILFVVFFFVIAYLSDSSFVVGLAAAASCALSSRFCSSAGAVWRREQPDGIRRTMLRSHQSRGRAAAWWRQR